MTQREEGRRRKKMRPDRERTVGCIPCEYDGCDVLGGAAAAVDEDTFYWPTRVDPKGGNNRQHEPTTTGTHEEGGGNICTASVPACTCVCVCMCSYAPESVDGRVMISGAWRFHSNGPPQHRHQSQPPSPPVCVCPLPPFLCAPSFVWRGFGVVSL